MDRVCSVTLLSKSAQQVNQAALLTSLQKHCGRVEPVASPVGGDKQFYAFAFPDFPVTYPESKVVPAQALISFQSGQLQKDVYADALQQSWQWRDAESVIAECKHSIMINDLMAGGLEPLRRLTLFHGVIAAVLEIMNCDAMYWRNSQQFIKPAHYPKESPSIHC